MTEPLIVATEGGVATVTLNRPEKRNAMSRAMLDGLCAAPSTRSTRTPPSA